MNEQTIPSNPFELFDLWYEEHKKTNSREPLAMTLATVNKLGQPSARTVLLKSHDKDGFVFFTNYQSNKGQELESNNHAQILFYWEALARQVRISGTAEKIPPAESDAYFATREYLSQIGAWASAQSKKIPNRDVLIKQVEDLKKKYQPGAVPRPPHWGGYRVKPTQFEFWLGQTNRLHDRFLYEKSNYSWVISRLSP